MSRPPTGVQRSIAQSRSRSSAVDAPASALVLPCRCRTVPSRSKSCNLSFLTRKGSVSMVEATINRVHSLLKVSREEGRAAGASLAILPDAAKFAFRGRPPSFTPVGEAFGVELPQAANRFNKAGNRKAYWLGPDEWLLEAPEENPVELFAQISNRLAMYSCSLVDVSHRS